MDLDTKGWKQEWSHVSYLLLGNASPPNLAAENNAHSLPRCFCGSGIWLQLAWGPLVQELCNQGIDQGCGHLKA